MVSFALLPRWHRRQSCRVPPRRFRATTAEDTGEKNNANHTAVSSSRNWSRRGRPARRDGVVGRGGDEGARSRKHARHVHERGSQVGGRTALAAAGRQGGGNGRKREGARSLHDAAQVPGELQGFTSLASGG